jgi:hypothetical protein
VKLVIGSRVARTPAGMEWRIGRRWIGRGLPRWRKVRFGKSRAGETAEAALMLPDIGGVDDIGAAVLVVVAVAVIAIVVVPLLLFGVELIVLGLVIAAGILGRALLGRPWVVQAVPVDGEAQVVTWRVSGWRRSARVIEEIVAALNAGRDPMPSETIERMPDALGGASSER